MSLVKGYYNEELFGKAIGRDVSCPIECNMDEDNIEYYLNDDSYPTKISKDELKLKCRDNSVSYDVLIKTNEINFIERTKVRCFNGYNFKHSKPLKLWEYSDEDLDMLYANVKIILDKQVLLCKMKSGSFSIVIKDIKIDIPPNISLRDVKEFFVAMVLSEDIVDEIDNVVI